MKNIFLSMLTVLCLSGATAYFCSQPAQASQEMLQVEKGLFDEVLKDNEQVKADNQALIVRMNALTQDTLALTDRVSSLERRK